MLIISKYKDYYDHVLKKTGIDNKIVFNRGTFEKQIYYIKSSNGLNLCPKNLLSNKYERELKKLPIVDFSILIICGKPIFIKTIKEVDSIVTIEDLKDKDVYSDLSNIVKFGYFEYYKIKKEKRKEYLHGKIYNNDSCTKEIDQLSRNLKSPIFKIIKWDKEEIMVAYNSPILSEIKGIPEMFPAEKLFNEISFYIGNVINADPEIVEVSNKSKILKAGFDLKTSFRNVKESC